MEEAAASTSENEQPPDWMLAREGIKLLINNKNKEAEELFLKYPDSLNMFAGYSFTIFLDALMTFEEENLTKSLAILKETEKRCLMSKSWFRALKMKMFSAEVGPSLAAEMEKQIILADSQVAIALIIFLQQEISGYFKGGWVLRKAWKIYRRVHDDLLALYKLNIGEDNIPDVAKMMSESASAEHFPEITSEEHLASEIRRYAISEGYTIPQSLSTQFTQNTPPNDPQQTPSESLIKKSKSVNSDLYKQNRVQNGRYFNIFGSNVSIPSYFYSTLNLFTPNRHCGEDLDRETIERLMGAVSFGYGLFQLGVSLLPPSVLRFTNILGFVGSRKAGIDCLMYARLGTDMRAPLATLALLWFHTIVRPYYALDGSNVTAGVDAATSLINESMKEYGESALFLFFKGRVHRLESDIPKALNAFQLAQENAAQQEIRRLCLHEVGWCFLIQLDYANAENSFYELQCSRWSRSFYLYLTTICAGSNDKVILETIQRIMSSNTNISKNNEIEEFLRRRHSTFPTTQVFFDEINSYFWKLLVFEVLYLWNSMASCEENNLDIIINDCRLVTEKNYKEPMDGLGKLIEGNCYYIRKDLQNAAEAFRSCLNARKGIADHKDLHVTAFAQYELASILVREETTKEEGKELLINMGQYKGYDFQDRLNLRVHTLLKHL